MKRQLLWLLLLAGCALPDVPVADPLALVDVASQDERSCGLLDDHRVFCWGLEAPNNVLTPTPLATPLLFRLIADQGSCAVPLEGAPLCWDGVTGTAFRTLEGAPDLVRLTVGSFPCGVDADAGIWCWLDSAGPATAISGGAALTGLEVGDFACGLDGTGVAKCFGGLFPATPTAFLDTITWKQFVPMHGWACGIRTTDSLVCFTFSPLLALGRLKTISTAPIVDGNKFVAISGSQFRATFRSNGGRAYSKTQAAVNVTAETSGVAWLSFTSGRGHTCGQLTTLRWACYGENSNGQLGDGTIIYRTGAVLIGGGAP